jgi:hypothetical protein
MARARKMRLGSVSLSQQFAGAYDLSFAALSDGQRNLVQQFANFFVPFSWDELDASRRQAVIEQIAGQYFLSNTEEKEVARAFNWGFYLVKVGYDNLGSRDGFRKWSKVRAHHLRQRKKSQGGRSRDIFTALLKRTAVHVESRGMRVRLKTVIEHLGVCDVDDILHPVPGALGPYGGPPDPKRSYHDRASALVYFLNRGTSRVEVISHLRISERLSRIKRKTLR